jgi:hypothetical protein
VFLIASAIIAEKYLKFIREKDNMKHEKRTFKSHEPQLFWLTIGTKKMAE